MSDEEIVKPLLAVALLIFLVTSIICAILSHSYMVHHNELVEKGYGRYNSKTGDFELIPIKELKEQSK